MSATARRGARPRRPLTIGRVLLWLVGLVLFVGITALLTLIVTSLWPGEAKLTARWECDDAHPEAFVVVDTSGTSDGGTAYEFSLYCADAEGDALDAGWGGPFVDLWIAHTAILAAIPVVVGAVGAVKRRATRRGSPDGDGDDGPPTGAAVPAEPVTLA